MFPADDWVPDALLDCIGAAVEQRLGQSATTPSADGEARQALSGQDLPLRRPLLQVSRVDSLQALEPFFKHASQTFYKTEAASVGVDWDNINDCLLREFFESIHVRST